MYVRTGTRSWARSTSRRRRKVGGGRRCTEWISPRGCAMASSWTASWLEGLSQVTCCACWRSGRMSTVRPTALRLCGATRLTAASLGARGDSGALFAGLDFGERAGRQRAAGAGGGRGAHWAGERLHELCGVARVGHDGQPFAQSRRLLHAPSVEGAFCVRVVTTDAIWFILNQRMRYRQSAAEPRKNDRSSLSPGHAGQTAEHTRPRELLLATAPSAAPSFRSVVRQTVSPASGRRRVSSLCRGSARVAGRAASARPVLLGGQRPLVALVLRPLGLFSLRF